MLRDYLGESNASLIAQLVKNPPTMQENKRLRFDP